MNAMEIARRLAELNETQKAQNAYIMALSQEDLAPEEELEASSYLFFSQSDHRLPFTRFVSLFNRGCFQKEILDLMTQAFYLPNVKKQQKQYEKNVKALSDYPYLFRKDFPAFEELDILFFPFDNDGFVPYYPRESRFGDYVNFNDSVIDRWFFKDLSKPILAEDVYSQYQLEYLNDNVRKSEWVAKENHIYLHYTNWAQFCTYLQVLNLKKLLAEEKLVFLMEEEISRYPIDFAREYGIDYSQYTVKPVGIREVKKLIWHTQLSSHNGGDFFNEILYGHPNLLTLTSVMFYTINELIQNIRKQYEESIHTLKNTGSVSGEKVVMDLVRLKEPTDKDILVSIFLNETSHVSRSDPNARIAPALLFQPHFHNFKCDVNVDKLDEKQAVLKFESLDEIKRSPIFKAFPYVKSFTPIRRPTTSYAATMRFIVDDPTRTEEEIQEGKGKMGTYVLEDLLTSRLLSRGYLVDGADPLFHDSRMVRFEDGKLNPKATFTALAEFLDIPYTESMTYCSDKTGMDPESLRGNDLGFSTGAIERTYPEYANDAERAFLEYFFKDAYEAYGYDFHYYKGEPVDDQWIEDKCAQFTCLDGLLRRIWTATIQEDLQKSKKEKLEEAMENGLDKPDENEVENIDELIKIKSQNMAEQILDKMKLTRLAYPKALLHGLRFVNKEGKPLQIMTPLKLDPALLEQPLYH